MSPMFRSGRKFLHRLRQSCRDSGATENTETSTSVTQLHPPAEDMDLDNLSKRIILPSLPVSDEERACTEHQELGQKLARQEQWEELTQLVQLADSARLTTPGGESEALLLVHGARNDVVAAAEDALREGEPPAGHGIAALEEMLEDHPDSYPCALVLALSHVDIARALMSSPPDTDSTGRDQNIETHLARADEVLARHDGEALDAPSVLSARCTLDALRPEARNTLADTYERLIDLDPDGPRHLRALGTHMLSGPAEERYENLELEARRSAARTGEIWGAGAYSWVYLDALAADRQALAGLDCDFFIDGMHDIVHHRPNQHVINLLAAFCAITMAPEHDAPGTAAEATQERLHACLDWLLADHLQELHPLIWAQAMLAPGITAPLPTRRVLVTKGRQTALRVIAERFADEIADGSTIAFSASGMYRLPAA